MTGWNKLQVENSLDSLNKKHTMERMAASDSIRRLNQSVRDINANSKKEYLREPKIEE